jgi:single-stranded DNA-binding protein
MPYPTIVAEGNLVDDIELKFYNEKACANFRIACNSRKKTETGEWVNTDPIYLSGSVWGKAAENTANTFKKGDCIEHCIFFNTNHKLITSTATLDSSWRR